MLEEHLGDLDLERLVAHALRYGKDVVAKRVGCALERANVPADRWEPLRTLPMRGFRAFDPTRVPRGPRIRRWGLIDNLSSPRGLR